MIFTEFIKNLEHELARPLPGMQVHLRMTSNRRLRELMNFNQQEQAIKSSVLILLYPGRDIPDPTFVVTLRPTYDGVHSGQISLPGGRFEFEDKDLMHTALRETREEIGINADDITIIGQLTELYIPPSNYLVHPFVGYSQECPVFHAQQYEVEKIIEIPLRQLLDENNVEEKEITAGGFHFKAPAFAMNGTNIWGATAMILNEFKEIVLRSGL
jgi:8-oxo-dGTP pyrophosphatase MutT (NUDIX family)